MSLPGERLTIAATLKEVTQGETFEALPPHMTVIRWFNLQDNRRFRLETAMDNLFTDKPVFANAIGGRKAELGTAPKLVPVRLVKGIDTVSVRADEEGNKRFVNPEWFALHALIQSLGKFDEDDAFKDVFLPHVSDTDDFALGYRKRPAFKSVAVFATEGEQQEHRVISSVPLGHK